MDQADALLRLQELDLALLRARKQLDELPEKRAILEVRAKQREVTELHGKVDMLVAKLNADLKAHQDEISTLTEKIDAEQTKVMETSDHRQVASITREMDGLKRRRDKVEMESLALMERIDKAKGQTTKIDEALAQLSQKETGLVERFKQVGGALQAEIAAEEGERARVAAVLDADLLARYEAARESKGGVGAGRLEGDSCSACRMALPAERISELAAGPEINVCPQCRRLIVVRPESRQ